MTTSIHHAEGQRSARGVSRTHGWRWLALSAVALAFIGCATLSSRKTDIIAKADARFQAGDDEQAFTYLENEMSKDRKDMIVANYYRRKAARRAHGGRLPVEALHRAVSGGGRAQAR